LLTRIPSNTAPYPTPYLRSRKKVLCI